jgi:hypothetical protein
VAIFEEDDFYTGPPFNSERLRQAETTLGVRLPQSYVDLLTERNGGVPRRRCFPTASPTSWADDHFEIRALLGVGGEWGIDTLGDPHGANIVAEWGYPEIGVVICDLPSGGHDTVMLDYSDGGSENEPAVAYIDEDRIPRRIADTFGDFFRRLVSCDQMSQ